MIFCRWAAFRERDHYILRLLARFYWINVYNGLGAFCSEHFLVDVLLLWTNLDLDVVQLKARGGNEENWVNLI
jgi:hypothetical protein